MDVSKIAADSMQRDLQRMQSISHNVANALTPGFKRQLSVAAPFATQVNQGMTGAGAAEARVAIDATAGTLRPTGIAQDIAIEGSAFLEAATPDGTRFTRQGALRLDNAGRLVGPHGSPILGTAGEIVLANAPFSIDAAGQIHQDGRIAGQLKLVHFKNAGLLQPAGGGLFTQAGAEFDATGMASSVRAGYLESSNVDTAREMVSLTETVRHFEALTRISQGYDEALGQAIRKLGEF